jgi:ubiquitin-conjugating enzyme E2 J1
MSAIGQFSSKNPTIKRILREAAELNSQPSSDYHAAPLESDLFEWHFTLRGPPAPSPFEGGVYHGRIVLPPAYPLKPPSFRFLTPTGRFEVNREICLSISGHHEETWQPAWGIRTALVAIRSFMDTDAKGQLGGMDSSEEARKRFAGQSKDWKCAVCGKTNEALMQEQEEVVKEHSGEGKKEEVPEELRLAYREELKEGGGSSKAGEGSNGKPVEPPTATATTPSIVAQASQPRQDRNTDAQPEPRPQRQQDHRAAVARVEGVPAWIDKAIYGVLIALLVLLVKKFG